MYKVKSLLAIFAIALLTVVMMPGVYAGDGGAPTGGNCGPTTTGDGGAPTECCGSTTDGDGGAPTGECGSTNGYYWGG